MHVASLRKEREVRLENLRPVIGEAREVMDRMGKVPNVAIEESLQSLSPELWDLSKANIELAGDMLDAVSSNIIALLLVTIRLYNESVYFDVHASKCIAGRNIEYYLFHRCNTL